MLLKNILKEVELTAEQGAIEIKDIKIDENKICIGDLFFDIKGDKNLNKLFSSGVSVVVREGKKSKNKRVVECKNIREIYALAAKHFYGDICDKLKIIGVTGTNGKSSSVKLITDILNSANMKAGSIGTVGGKFEDKCIDTGFTTPDPHILHSLFFKMYKSGIRYVAMEVSAHAIALKKLSGIKFEIMALTNITQDHLDFFGNMQEYANTKLSIFNSKQVKQGLLCYDDEYSRKLKCDIPIISYGIENPSDIFAIDIKSDFSGSEFICNCLDEVFVIKSNLIGKYNVENALCAIGVLFLIGVSKKDIIRGMKESQAEAGRFNVITFNGINVVIDYAHTPDGLKKILETLKPLCKGNLYVLFGCGGNRDKLKRPIMGMIAELYADCVFLTSDNPRFEDPEDIIEDIKKGMTLKMVHTNIDRKEMIQAALYTCKEKDVLLIAGKGGEKYQDINGEKIEYSDFDEVYNFFRNGLKLVKNE